MNTIGRSKLVELIKSLAKGTKIINVTYVTDQSKNLKKACPFKNVTKTTNNTCMLGVNYANRLEKVGETPAGKDPWFSEIDGQNWVVKHDKTGRTYLRLSPTGNNKPKSIYADGDNIITKTDLEPYLYKKSGDAPEVFTVAVDTIKSIKMAGQEYRVVDDSRIGGLISTETTTATA
jgi:hypothetical protein